MPESTQRRSVGIVPDCSAHWATGNGTPSSWTNTTPSISGSATLACLRPKLRSVAVKASSVPAVASQVRKVPIAAAIQVAATNVQKDVTSTPGRSSRAMCMITACPATAKAPTANQPMVLATLTNTGRRKKPNTPVTAAAATSHQGDLACMPGNSQSAAISARELIAHARAMRARSETRSLATMFVSLCGVCSVGVTHRG